MIRTDAVFCELQNTSCPIGRRAASNKEKLREREGIAFANDRRFFRPLVAVDHHQDFVRPDGGVTAHGAVCNNKTKLTVTHPAAQQLGHIVGACLPAVVGADDVEAIGIFAVTIPITIAVTDRAVVPIVAVAAHSKHGSIHKATFFIFEFPLFVLAVSGPDAQMLLGADGGIAAHGLIVDGHAAVDAAAADEVFHDAGDIVVLGSRAVLGAHDRPAVILGT